MFLLAHLQRYVADHPEHHKGSTAGMMERARRLAGKNGLEPINSGEAQNLLGEHAEEFLTLLSTHTEYLEMSMQAVGANRSRR